MKKWLDKYNDGGPIQENYNDAQVSVGPNYIGTGYDTTGRNYSPAWGGQFQMGGALPGATGMMYARTINPAPDNGKYAKKTKASAQNGKEMEFYQNGLDWKPNNISKNGKSLKKGQLGITTGVNSGTVDPTIKPSTKAEIADIALNKILDKQGSINKAEPKRSHLSKTWAAATHPMTVLEHVVKGRGIPEHFERGPKNVLDYAVDIVNPYQIADAAGSIPGNLARGEFGEAALNALNIVPTLSEIKGIGTAAKQLSRAKNLKEALAYTLEGIPVERSLPRLAEGELKTFRQIQEIPKMAQAGKSRAEQMKYALENNIPDEHFQRIFETDKRTAQDLINSGFGERPASRVSSIQPEATTTPSGRLRDIYSRQINDIQTNEGIVASPEFYESLGHRTIPTSHDQMTTDQLERLHDHLVDRMIGQNESSIPSYQELYDLDPELYDLSDFDEVGNYRESSIYMPESNEAGRNLDHEMRQSMYEQYIRNNNIRPTNFIKNKINTIGTKAVNKLEDVVQNSMQSYPYYSGEVEQRVPSLFRSQEGSLKDVAQKVNKQAKAGDIPSGTVFTGSLNTSHNSWLPQVKQVFSYEGGSPQFTGYKPMNSLGYLSQANVPQEDIVKYLNSEMDQLVKKGKIPDNVQRPYMFEGHPMLPQYAIKQHREGGIVDPMGQWAHPGEVTTIPGNDITMKGVPYPVLGVSDKGDKKMMKPGKDYKFKGNKVTEYPIAEFGDYFQDSGQAQIGGAVGEAAGNALFGPLGGMAGKLLGNVAGNLLGGAADANKLARLQSQTKANAGRTAMQQSLQSGQFSSFMKNGGWLDKYK